MEESNEKRSDTLTQCSLFSGSESCFKNLLVVLSLVVFLEVLISFKSVSKVSFKKNQAGWSGGKRKA